MNIFLLFLILIIFSGAGFFGSDQFNTDYLDKKHTAAVNGIFVILVVFSHYFQYADFTGEYDLAYTALRTHLNQMVVASFLFYSGYGMMEAFKAKRDKYIKKMLTKFWQLLFRTDIAVLMFLLLDYALDIHYPAEHIAKSLILWESVGNSNWYIFVILVLYLIIYISFSIGRLFPDKVKDLCSILLVLILTIGFVYVLMKAEKDRWWYNTMILLPLGFMYSRFKDTIEKILWKDDLIFYIVAAGFTAVYMVSYMHRWDYGIEGYSVWAISFVALMILFTMKVSIYNEVLEWFGRHVFSVYMLQRLPMIAFSKLGYIEDHKYMCLIAVFAVMIPLAIAFEKVTGKMINSIEKIGKGNQKVKTND